MNILITGGLGHIGSHFLNSINKVKKINQVYIIDNNSNNRINSLFKFKKKKIRFIFKDLCDVNCFKTINNKIDIVLHLASITNAEASIKDKDRVYNNNFNSFKNIVKFAKKNNSKFIHISSTSVYGSQDKIIGENCRELKPQSPYADVKLLEEKYLKKTKNISFISLRFGTIVGYSLGMRFHTAVNKFCFNAITNSPITVWETAIDQFRPYLSIDDAFNCLKFIIEKKYFDNKVHNILSNNYTVRQILSFIKKFKKRINIKYTKSKIMNQLSYKVINQTGLLRKIKLKKEINSDIKSIFFAFKNIV
jgi:UDP-glucose 4-epimerase